MISIPVTVPTRYSVFPWRIAARVSGNGSAWCLLAVVLAAVLSGLAVPWRTFLLPQTSGIRPVRPPVLAGTQSNWSDRFGDGTPDFLRLRDPADQAAFRRWFTVLAESQALRPRKEIPSEITDCASLLRYAYRESLRRHDAAWLMATGMDLHVSLGEIRAWHYPETPLGLGLFRIVPGPFQRSDTSNGAFAQFADAKTLIEDNTYRVARDTHAALPGDLLFFRQFGHSEPWHSMILTEVGPEAAVVYDTGPNHGVPGELRRVALSELLDHPEPEWRPVPDNPNFLGVYRWNILRGAS